MKYLSETIQMKASGKVFPVVLLTSCQFVFEIRMYDYSSESHHAFCYFLLGPKVTLKARAQRTLFSSKYSCVLRLVNKGVEGRGILSVTDTDQ